MKDKVDMRFSDTDLCAYLILKGYDVAYIEVSNNKRHNKLKAFTHFVDDKDILLTIKQEYEKDNIEINIPEFSKRRKYLNYYIKLLLNKHRNNNENKSIIYPSKYISERMSKKEEE